MWSKSNWRTWIASHRATSEQHSERTGLFPVKSVRGMWQRLRNGDVARSDGGFFRVTGLLVRAAREVPLWWQPMLVDRGEGVVVLVMSGDYCLVQAKFEPGNPGAERIESRDLRKGVLIAPTIQASWSNYFTLHQGKKPLLADLVTTVPAEAWTRICKDGNRFMGKVNRHAVLRIDPTDSLVGSPPPGMLWVSCDDLRDIICEGECNEHLVQTVGLMWASRSL